MLQYLGAFSLLLILGFWFLDLWVCFSGEQDMFSIHLFKYDFLFSVSSGLESHLLGVGVSLKFFQISLILILCLNIFFLWRFSLWLPLESLFCVSPQSLSSAMSNRCFSSIQCTSHLRHCNFVSASLIRLLSVVSHASTERFEHMKQFKWWL